MKENYDTIFLIINSGLVSIMELQLLGIYNKASKPSYSQVCHITIGNTACHNLTCIDGS